MKDEEKTIEQIITELNDMEKRAAGKKSKKPSKDSEKDVTFAEGESQQSLGESRGGKAGDESTGHSEEQDLEEQLEDVIGEEPFEELFKGKESLREPKPGVPAEDLIREELHDETTSEESFDQMFSEESSEKSLSEEQGGEPPEEPPTPPRKRVPKRISQLTVFFGIVLLAGVLSVLFVYPTMYERRSMKYGDKTYPVKINRITQSVQYYDGKKWRNKPLTRISSYRGSIKFNREKHQAGSRAAQETFPNVSPPKVLPETSANIPAETSPENVVKAPAKTTGTTSEKSHVSDGRPFAKRDPEKTAKVTEKTVTEQKLGSQDKTRPQVEQETDVITQEKPYTIQISSMRSLILAKMLLNDLKKNGMDALMYRFETRNQGVWHVIFVGHFTDGRTAITYMKKEKINDTYPGSFVRKTPRYASNIRKEKG
jgi:cell division septation protein DedD